MNIGIITGASSGMGKEFVKLTMQNHLELDEIWVIARRKERLEAWSDLYKEQKFRILPLDLQKKEDMDYLGKTLEEVQPHIELFIHCAGFGIMGRIQEISMEEQAEMVDVNCRSVVEVSSLVLPYMKYRGRMIYMASAAAFLPQPGFAVYAASKAFVLSYVRALRAESREKQLRVTAVCPGWNKFGHGKADCIEHSRCYLDNRKSFLSEKSVQTAYLYWLLKQRFLFPPQYHAGHSMAVL